MTVVGKRTQRALMAVVLGLLATTGRAGAQASPAAEIELSADTVEMGELFELRVTVSVPANSLLFLPDTLPATPTMESAHPVRVDAAPAANGAARVTLAYPMMAFGAGMLPVPGFDILVTPRDRAAGTSELPGGSATGDWSEAPRVTGTRLTRIPRQAVWVDPFFTPAELVGGVEPKPPNDVRGGDWSWPALMLLALCASLLSFTLAAGTKGILEQRVSRGAPPPPASPAELRFRALSQLDALLAQNRHREGRLLDFFTSSSDIVRRYVERVGDGWSSSLTSAELMRRLRTRYGDDAAGSLPHELELAEIVKFGRLRPDGDTAETHWRALRDWVESSGEGTW